MAVGLPFIITEAGYAQGAMTCVWSSGDLYQHGLAGWGQDATPHGAQTCQALIVHGNQLHVRGQSMEVLPGENEWYM